MDWSVIIELIVSNIPGLVIALVALGLGYLLKKKWITEEAANAFKETVGAVVNETYQEFVKPLKKDGKFDISKHEEARKLALIKLKESGKEKGVDFLKEHGLGVVMHAIETAVQANKK